MLFIAVGEEWKVKILPYVYKNNFMRSLISGNARKIIRNLLK